MINSELLLLMRLCSERGLQDWANASHDSRKMAQECLSGRIVANAPQIGHLISGKLRHVKELYIPMPLPPSKSKHRGFEQCFFLPENANGILAKLILALLIPVVHDRNPGGDNRTSADDFDGNCLAFRFEIAHGPDTAHGYSHVQLTKRTEHSDLPCVPEWFPDSYPAIPVRACDPLDLFLSMMTAVYGFPRGVDVLIQDIFQKHSRAAEAHPYRERLESMLACEPEKEPLQVR